MKKITVLLAIILVIIGCKKSSNSGNQQQTQPGTSSVQGNYKKLKSTRNYKYYAPANDGPHISNTFYIYDNNGRLYSMILNDSDYYNNTWTVYTNTITMTYASNGKIGSKVSATGTDHYVYDGNNNIKYAISGSDTAKYVIQGGMVIATFKVFTSIFKRFYSQNFDSMIVYDSANVVGSRQTYTRNNTLDLRYAYINQFLPIIEDKNEIIQSYEYPTGNLPSNRSFTITYNNDNYPVKQQCIDQTETYTYY